MNSEGSESVKQLKALLESLPLQEGTVTEITERVRIDLKFDEMNRSANRRLIEVKALASAVFESEERGVAWLCRYKRGLGGVPLDMLDTEEGVARVLQLLHAIEHGLYL